jgi:hypothetical protein
MEDNISYFTINTINIYGLEIYQYILLKIKLNIKDVG